MLGDPLPAVEAGERGRTDLFRRRARGQAEPGAASWPEPPSSRSSSTIWASASRSWPDRSGRAAGAPPRTRACRADLLELRRERGAVGAAAGSEHVAQDAQRRPGLQHPAALQELLQHDRRSRSSPLRSASAGASSAARRARSGADQRDGQPDAEQPEPVQQVGPLELGERGWWVARRTGRRSAAARRSPARRRAASAASIANSASRSVVAAYASSPATGTTTGHSRRSRGSALVAAGDPRRRRPARRAGTSRSRRPATARRPRSPGCRGRARRRGTPRGSARRWRACAASGRARRRRPAPGRPRPTAPGASARRPRSRATRCPGCRSG